MILSLKFLIFNYANLRYLFRIIKYFSRIFENFFKKKQYFFNLLIFRNKNHFVWVSNNIN